MQFPELDLNDYLGGAPHAEIVPVRIANSVVHFYTSAMARGIDYAINPGEPANAQYRCDVVSISMGGVASDAWADAANRAYEAGVCIVAAAGNNYGGLPTRSTVYPARFGRVIAACGVMADGKPYYKPGSLKMQGNFGPDSKMKTALAAFTPNIPWAQIGCPQLVDLDGAGTSAATPQIAAAAALWLQHHDPRYDQPWKRVEAVRNALFASARQASDQFKYFGNGILQAAEALKLKPATDLTMTPADSVAFPLFKVLFGLGLKETNPKLRLYELEMIQLSQSSKEVAELVKGFDEATTKRNRSKLHELVDFLADERSPASDALRQFIRQRFGGTGGTPSTPPRSTTPFSACGEIGCHLPIERPPHRRLRAYAFDPSLSNQLENAAINTVTIRVPWEHDRNSGKDILQKGPVGEYLEVVDVDPSSGCYYEPVDLNNPYLLAQDGLAPSEANPQFHQQMVYAVAMTTIKHFELALGRVVMWSPRKWVEVDANGREEKCEEYVPRLRIYPHALREENAYYSPEKKSLLFGYFPATSDDVREHLPGGMVFACLSHDIIAHETTHAILDGIHPRYNESSNPDMMAFHEAFADIVALFQHFTFPEVLRHQIAKTRGDLTSENLLAQLAQEFGQATGGHGSLRDALGEFDKKKKKWVRSKPDPSVLNETFEPHKRGSILVAAIFDAFVSIYRGRTSDLFRIATGGTGVLPEGNLPPDLVNRLAGEAAKAAGHVLTMCIRALDYCPPMDLTFGDYLRALITADWDLVPNDERNYRLAIVTAFRNRGIYPADVTSISVDSLRWAKPTWQSDYEEFDLDFLKRFIKEDISQWDQKSSRKDLYDFLVGHRKKLHWLFESRLSKKQPLFQGLKLDEDEVYFEVHSVRPVRRVSPNGDVQLDLLIEFTQRRRGYLDGSKQNPATDYRFGPSARHLPEADFIFRGGGTLIVSMETFKVRYYIFKDITSEQRLQRQREFLTGDNNRALRELYFGDKRKEPFAMLHRLSSSED